MGAQWCQQGHHLADFQQTFCKNVLRRLKRSRSNVADRVEGAPSSSVLNFELFLSRVLSSASASPGLLRNATILQMQPLCGVHSTSWMASVSHIRRHWVCGAWEGALLTKMADSLPVYSASLFHNIESTNGEVIFGAWR